MHTEAVGCWVGVDWGGKEHAVCVVGADGVEVTQFTMRQAAGALQGLAERLRALGPVAGVAVETPRHLLVDVLVEGGYAVYPINPRVSHAWRQCSSVGGAKDDRRDAWVLADGLRHHHAKLRAFVPERGPARVLGLLCEDECRFIGQRTALVQQLEDTLKQYFPAALEWFSDWTTQTAWDFVLAFPTAAQLASARPAKLAGFLRTHRVGLGPVWQKRIAARTAALDWPCNPDVVAAKSVLALALAKQLRTVQATLRDYRKQIDALFERREDKAVFTSLPGAGRKLAPRLASAFGTQRDQVESADVVQQVTGTAPVTVQSAAHRSVHIRRACRKDARCTLHHFAWQSLKQSVWAKAAYSRARRKGQKHATALRFVANKWLKIIYRMWQTGEPYDEERYLRQLTQKKSPIAYDLGLLKT